MKKILKKEYVILFLLFIFVFSTRLIYLFSNTVIEPDGIAYIEVSKKLMSVEIVEGICSYESPFYPSMIGLFSLLFNDFELSGRLVSMFFGCLLMIPVYLISKRIYGSKVGYFSVLLLSMHPELVRYSTNVAGVMTNVCLIMIGAYIGQKALIKDSKWLYLLTGFVISLAYLTRPESLLFIGSMVFIIIILGIIFYNSKSVKKLIVNVLLLIIGFSCMSLPYLWVLYKGTGSFVICGKWAAYLSNYAPVQKISNGDPYAYQKHVYSLNEEGTKIVGKGYLQRSQILSKNKDLRAKDFFLKNLKKFIPNFFRNLYYVYKKIIPDMCPPLLMILIALGLFNKSWTIERLRLELYLIIMFLSPIVIISFIATSDYYFSPIIPFCIIWGGKGLEKLQNWFVETFKKIKNRVFSLEKVKKIATVCLVLLVLISFFPNTFITIINAKFFYYMEPVELKAVGKWIKDNLPNNSVIMASCAIVRFYAGDKKFVIMPYADFSKTLKYIEFNRVKYIELNERITPKSRPELTFLLDKKKVPKNFKIIYERDEPREKKVLVYEVMY